MPHKSFDTRLLNVEWVLGSNFVYQLLAIGPVENFPSAFPMLSSMETASQNEIIPEWFKNLPSPFTGAPIGICNVFLRTVRVTTRSRAKSLNILGMAGLEQNTGNFIVVDYVTGYQTKGNASSKE
jgi:hypothetical protein